jgi:hypothetical protein
LVSFDAPIHFKKATVGTIGSGWVSMDGVEEHFETNIISLAPSSNIPQGTDNAPEIQDNPFYHPAINRHATITSDPRSGSDHDVNRGTQGFGLEDNDAHDNSMKKGITFKENFNVPKRRIPGATVALANTGRFDRENNQRIDGGLSVRMSQRIDVPTRSGIQKYSWQHHQAKTAFYR